MLDFSRLGRPASLFDDYRSIPVLGLDPRFAGLVRLAGLGYRGKTLETRGISTTYRGPLVIAATTGAKTKGHPELGAAFLRAHDELVPDVVAADIFEAETTRTSCAVALVTLTGVRVLDADDWPRAFMFTRSSPPRYVWELANLWPLDPYPVRCAQLFGRGDIEDAVEGLARHVAGAWTPWKPDDLGACVRCWGKEGPLGVPCVQARDFARVCRNCFDELGFDHATMNDARFYLEQYDLPGLGKRWDVANSLAP